MDYFQVVSSPAINFIDDYTVTGVYRWYLQYSVPRNATEIAETKIRVIFTCSVTAMELLLIYLLHRRSAAYIAVYVRITEKML